MAQLANLVVRISGNTAQLNKAVGSAETRMDKFRAVSGKALGALKVGLAGAAAGAVGFGIAAIKNFVEVGDEIDKMSRRTGVGAVALSELRFAAEQAGADLGTVEKGLKRMASAIFDAEQGLAETERAFDALGITLADVQGLKPDEQMQVFANALANVEDASTRAALAQDIFGRAGTNLLPLFTAGEEGMAALRKQAHDLGAVFTQDAAASAADLKDAQNELNKAIQGVTIIIGTHLAPTLTMITREITKLIVATQDFNKWLDKVSGTANAFGEGLRLAAAGLGLHIPKTKEASDATEELGSVLKGVTPRMEEQTEAIRRQTDALEEATDEVVAYGVSYHALRQATDADMFVGLLANEYAANRALDGIKMRTDAVAAAMHGATQATYSMAQAIGALNQHQAGGVGAGIGGASRLGFGTADFNLGDVAALNQNIRSAAVANAQAQGRTVNVNFNAPVYGTADFNQAVNDAVLEHGRRN